MLSKSFAVTINARSACCSGAAKPPQTTSPSTSKITTSVSSSRWCCFNSLTVCPTTYPPHPVPAGGPPASTHLTPLKPSKTKSSGRNSSAWKSTSFKISITVGTNEPVKVKVLSCLGSHPICSTRLPSLEKAADKLELVVDLPMPPFPYTEKTLAPSIFMSGSW